MKEGNYFWRSKEKFTKKKGKRIFVSATSPPSFTLDNYKEVLLREGLGQAFINTFAVAIPSTLIPLIICSFFAYSLTWMRFYGRDLLLATVIAALVVPLQMSLIPILSIYNDIGALFGVAAKSFPGIWMAHTGFGLASTTFLLWNFLKSLPNEMMEAARVDGATHYDTFIKIVVPLSIPAFASIFILQFLWVWNDLLVGLVFLRQTPKRDYFNCKVKRASWFSRRELGNTYYRCIHLDECAIVDLLFFTKIFYKRISCRFGERLKERDKMSNRIVIIGAGSTNFGLGIVGDFFKSKILEGSTLVLHDINAKTLENTKEYSSFL